MVILSDYHVVTVVGDVSEASGDVCQCRDSFLSSLTMAHFHIQAKSMVLHMQRDTCVINTMNMQLR
jgi:hypothetical protein